jgi:hypothetical protein
MWQKNGFDWFPEFKSKGIEFEVGDKYLFRQLTGLLICCYSVMAPEKSWWRVVGEGAVSPCAW